MQNIIEYSIFGLSTWQVLFNGGYLTQQQNLQNACALRGEMTRLAGLCGKIQRFNRTLLPTNTQRIIALADIRKLTDDLSVAPQLIADDIAEAESRDFKSILCNRPDEEETGQPAYSIIKQKIDESGLAAEFQPVNGQDISDQDVDAFAAHIENLPKPVLAYCRSGTRCTVLWALSEAGKRPTEEIVAIAAAAGYGLDPLRPRIEDRAGRMSSS